MPVRACTASVSGWETSGQRRLRQALESCTLCQDRRWILFQMGLVSAREKLHCHRDIVESKLHIAIPLVSECYRLPDFVPVYAPVSALVRLWLAVLTLSLIHISEPTRLGMISYAV